ncbi:MAG: DNA polymerase I [Candidatus Omnitrophica bacterium]|nr:DNA polymerase I [Candidatus Omnitrophota bacterium]
MSERILLIDGHALCYRAFYAVAELRNSKGQATNAVFGFVNILRKILKTYAPAYVAACFDTGKETFRRAKFADYKIQRQAMPEDLAAQMPVIKDLLRAYGIPVFEKEGYEADDLIATFVDKFRAPQHEIIIASDDKDMQQLISDGVRIYNSRKDALLGPDDTHARFGVGPERVVDYLALAGDASDNIPGVSGVGDVTAQKLLKEFGSLEQILARTPEIKGKLREKIEQGRDAALLSMELATLDPKVPLDCALDDIRYGRMDRMALVTLFTELEFRRLADEFSAAQETIAGPVRPGTSLSVNDGGNDVAQCLGLALLTGSMAVLPVMQADEEGRRSASSFLISSGGVVFSVMPEDLASFRDFWLNATNCVVVYDAKALLKALALLGLELKVLVFDVMLAGYLLRSGQGAFDIPALAHVFLDIVIPDGPHRWQHEVAALEKLYEPLKADLKVKEMSALFHDMEMPLCSVLAAMELEGVSLNIHRLKELSLECDTRIAAMTENLYALAGGAFNLNSPKQLGVVLFEKLALPVIKKTKTGPSTDEEVLTRLAPMHALPALILEYRQLAKLKSTYLDALPTMVDGDGRIRCTFNQAGAETGRLSADHPNLQNIPVRTDIGRKIREAFVARSARHILLSADYSQIELRFLAHFAGDPKLIEAFRHGEDIHTFTAALIFEVPHASVTTEMRYRAKRINFGIVYGMSAFGLSKDLGVAPREAQDFIDRYFLRYPGIQAFMSACEAKAREEGFVTTLFGRRRYIPDINSRNMAVRQFAERQSANSPIQGSAADLIKGAMVAMDKMLKENNFKSKMIMTVHDELVFDCPVSEVDALAVAVKRIMENAVTLSVPIEVTLKKGMSWAEMKSI